MPQLSEFRTIAAANTLRTCQLFSGIPANDLETIASFVIPKRLEKGEYLFHEVTKSEGF